MSTHGRLRAQVNIALTEEDMRALELYSWQERRPPGQLARLIVEEWIAAKIKEEGLPPEPPKPKAERRVSPFGRLPR